MAGVPNPPIFRRRLHLSPLVIEEARKAGNVSRTFALSEVADLSILREAQKELGIKSTVDRFFSVFKWGASELFNEQECSSKFL